MLHWLLPGRDHQLAAERYAGRESATERAERLARDRRWGDAVTGDRKTAKWERKDRRRFG